MAYFLELSINGAVAGSLYALVALAFVVVYKASKVINFALGELVMLATALVGYAMVTFGVGLGPAMVFAGLMMAVVAAAHRTSSASFFSIWLVFTVSLLGW